nr:helix-turn-helix transcriptional regulator [Actinomycetota bacterium]
MPTETLPSPPKNFLRSCLLLLLRERAAHGYDLLERLRSFGFKGEDPGRLYRALRALEREDLVRSAWQHSSAGPDRRIYELTRAGKEDLHQSATALAATRQALQDFLSRYEEFVALDPAADAEPAVPVGEPAQDPA